jgi:hypothetical protein
MSRAGRFSLKNPLGRAVFRGFSRQPADGLGGRDKATNPYARTSADDPPTQGG